MKNSLSSIERRIEEILSHGDLTQLSGLTEAHIREGKTPRGIAELWLHDKLSGIKSMGPVDDTVTGTFPLLPFSQVVFDSMRDGGVDRWTFCVTMRTSAMQVDVERLRTAVETVLQHHPIFSMRIDDSGLQHYERNYRTPYISFDISEENGEVCFLVRANRILGDATSFALLLNNISLAYMGEPLPKDNLLHFLHERQRHPLSPSWEKSRERLCSACESSREWLHSQFDNLTAPTTITPDIPFGKEEHSSLAIWQESLEGYSIQDNANTVLTLATALAIMDYNDTDEAALTWAYVGRETAEQQAIFGSLHRDVPFVLSRKENVSYGEMLAEARRQIEQGIIHSDYPYTFLAERRDVWRNAVNVLIQPTFVPEMCGAQWSFSLLPASDEAYCALDVEFTQSPLTLTIKYSSGNYGEQSIQRFASLIKKNIIR